MIVKKNDPDFDNICHLCGRQCKAQLLQDQYGVVYVNCVFAERLILMDDIKTDNFSEYNRRLNIILFDLMRRRRSDRNMVDYYYDASSNERPSNSDNSIYINVHYLLHGYPRWMNEILQYSKHRYRS